MSVIFPAHTQSREQPFNEHGQIALADNTTTREERGEQLEPVHSPGGSSDAETPTPLDKAFSKKLSRKGTRDTWKDERAKWKYRKYTERRYADEDASSEGGPSRPGISARTSMNKETGLRTSGVDTSEPPTPSTPAALSPTSPTTTTARTTRLQRKVKELFARRHHTAREGDTAIDVLWENQRGWFFFGMPLFSSQSLLNFDPPAWLNTYGKPSGVDVTNAQVPDPSWRWDWHTWYVDMSPDVDEEGWQYSFMFQNKFPWHGTHPWLHSFVRRRRWIRERVRRRLRTEEGKRGLPEPHKFSRDYFTVHAGGTMGKASSAVLSASQHPSTGFSGGEEDVDEEEEVENISTLLRRLRNSTVDRDKINLVLQFIDQGGEDTYHLADEIPHILSLFLYQHSRRRLLSLMLHKIGAASDHREEHQRREAPEFKNEKRKIDDLLRAVKSTEQEVQRLEFWSDVKDVVRKRESFGALAMAEGAKVKGEGWDRGWAELDSSGGGTREGSAAGDDEKGEKGKQAKTTVDGLHSSK